MYKYELEEWQSAKHIGTLALCRGCVSVLYLSLEVKGQAGDAVRVHVLEDGHSLHRVGVPYADVGLLSHLPRGHQHTLRMQG